jgi:hypothetical protein
MDFENGTGPGKCVFPKEPHGDVKCAEGYILLGQYKCIHPNQYNECEQGKWANAPPPHKPNAPIPEPSESEDSVDTDTY